MTVFVKDPREKQIGDYTVRRRNSSYVLTIKRSSGKTSIIHVQSTIHTDKGWRDDDIKPFLEQQEIEDKSYLRRTSKAQYESMIDRVAKSYKKKTGKSIPKFKLKKQIKAHADVVKRQMEIKDIVKNLKNEELETKYKDAIFTTTDDGVRRCKIDDKEIMFNDILHGLDLQMNAIPKDVEGLKLWEIYGEEINDDKNEGE